MSRKPLYTNEQIIEVGEALERAHPGREIDAWRVYDKLGLRGKYERVREIWDTHREARKEKGSPAESYEKIMPSHFRESLDKIFGDFGNGIEELFMNFDSHISSQYNRQIRILQEDHDKSLSELKEELAFWRNRASTLEQELGDQAPHTSVRAQEKRRETDKSPKSSPSGPLPGQMTMSV
ncbi:hypothetical protein [Acidimangrovimonas pyrenivorans]|uniref:KfrA N-terminal DNA-binding domain-containing protein n=1 Tax=Acidimangrovimonas pyrenivorans TaxID=2030798 RepID=A0ABV7ABY2_9RHOB